MRILDLTALYPVDVPRDCSEMPTFGHPTVTVPTNEWRRGLVFLAILALALSLVSRYTANSSRDLGNGTSFSSYSAKSKTQHLLLDGLQWCAPVASVVMFVIPRRPVRIVRLPLPVTDIYSEDWLYNRPPPLC